MASILVIEDNRENGRLMAYLLGAFGHDAQITVDGEAGLRALEGGGVDLVVCDIDLPGMDGYEVVASIKRDAATCRVPVVAVTALAMVGDRDRLLEAGFDAYISKPIDPQTFVGQIEELLPQSMRRETAASTAGEPTANEPQTGHSGAVLLVVDDVHENRELSRAILEPSGYRVTLSENIREALSAARRTDFDLILCDLRMPEGDGLALLAACKEDPRLQDIPFVVITASRWTAAERKQAFALGALRFLEQPIEPRRLLAEIEACIGDGKER